jgi:tetratricopeptide (TPR) repeat protein
MNFFRRFYGKSMYAAVVAALLFSGGAVAQDYSSLGISDVVASADRLLQRGDYSAAIPALREVINRTEALTDPQGRQTCQTCRFQLARAYYQTGDVAAGMKILDVYLNNEPRTKERLALRMLAQGFFDTQDWGKIEEVAKRLLGFSDLDREDRYNANLLLGQALFRQEKWQESVDPLAYAANNAKEPHIRGLCQIMIVRALVEAENWRALFGWIPRIYRTDSKYDITLNLTLMKAGKARFEADDYLNSLLLYRMVLPREELLDFANERVEKLETKLDADITVGIDESTIEERRNEIKDIRESIKTLSELPPYEDEVAFRIGQIYAEVLRYWEGYVLFDKLYETSGNDEIQESSLLQSVLILYDVQEIERAEERIIEYLTERPEGIYARTLLSMMLRDNLQKQNADKIISMRPYLDAMPATQDPDELQLQADLHFMTAFGYFFKKDFKPATEQLTIVLDNYPDSSNYSDARYYRGMTYLMQAEYANALQDFKTYQEKYETGAHYAAAMFREGVCHFGLEDIPNSEATFTKFIEAYPDDQLVSEAYSMRGDIEAAKEASNEDPHTLDRALKDYRKAIDTSTSPLQSSYAAFQAAKVYKLEFKWQEIIDLMNYYIDLREEEADVAEAVFWIGQAQLELGQVDEGIKAYLGAIERFGNDPAQLGVDNIIKQMVTVSFQHLSAEDQEGLALKLKLKLTDIDEKQEVLRLRLEVTQAMLEGEDVAAALGAKLLADGVDLKITSPVSLALMCDAAVATGNAEEMIHLAEHFITSYEESDVLWHAYRAKAFSLLAKEDYWNALAAIDEAQGLFGAEPFMGWAQIMKADILMTLEKYEDAEAAYNMVLGVAEWRGAIFAEAMYGMGKSRMARGDLETAHSFFQRTYLLFKSYADGDWAAKGYLAAADTLLKLDRQEDAVKTLQAMLEDEYTNTNPLAEQVREQLKNFGGSEDV